MTPHETLGLSIEDAQNPEALKKAYHAALLKAHPDTRGASSIPESTVGAVKRAYLALSTDLLHGKDEGLAREKFGYAVVDLSEFEEVADETAGEAGPCYWLDCRCGHGYRLTEDDLEHGRDLVMCDGCSLLVRVLYQEVAEDETA
ncbi:hypothetical protein BCR37DRAFT_394274 [Protomyces lactucae-debilis]|uniref:Diphthamide biosynthesis protein 4 n=1 Tax=Protomyces lactucae-debilis TaxID=2754530 RepID=A0A1Y2F6P3_PROLT|nr:uncharacterized protein BCR37DRAFT_394274 [Protomyces lactucae-debilis]ORY79553.1 hypothetical protein BCR37DRAFT_394274 [Protomyces lactucae-debilis]